MLGKLKSLASDTLIYGVFTIIGRFLTFLLTPIYTNYIPMKELGDVIYLFSFFAFLNILNTIGMESAFFRFYSKDDINLSKKVYTHAFISILLFSLFISLIILIFAVPISSNFKDIKDAVFVIRISALIPLVDTILVIPYALLRMTRKARKFSLIRFCLITIAVVLNVIFLAVIHTGAKGIFLAQLIASTVGLLVFSKDIFENLKLKLDWKLFKDMFRFGIPTLPANLSAMVLQIADRQILKPLTDSSSVALYSVNYRLGIPMMLMVSIFEYAWKPFYLGNFQESDSKSIYARVLTYFTMMCAGVFLCTGLFVEFIVRLPFVGGRLIAPVYWSGLGIIPIILGGYYFNGVFTNFAAGFHITKKTEYLPIAVGIAAVVNIALNFLTIPIFGIWGAAWATLIAYAVSAGILYYFVRKIYPLKYEWKRVGIIILSTLIVYGLSIYFSKGLDLFISFGIRIAALILFFVLLWIFGFFTKGEIQGIKRLFSRKKIDVVAEDLD
jgi:O-antigen/teichoic acid export membrane protein